jgi:hypothetical protein
MQNEPKSAEVTVIQWLADYFLSCRFDVKAETAYLRPTPNFDGLRICRNRNDRCRGNWAICPEA